MLRLSGGGEYSMLHVCITSTKRQYLDDFVVPPTTYLFKHFTYLQHFTTITGDGHAALGNSVK